MRSCRSMDGGIWPKGAGPAFDAPSRIWVARGRFLLVWGGRDNGGWGLIGAFWLSIDGERGGFVGSPEALWQGSEMVRSHRGAIARRWAQEEVYSYWQGQVGMSGSVMI